MKATVFLDPADLVITGEQVARQTGGHGYRPDDASRHLIATQSALAKTLIAPAFTYAITDTADAPDWVAHLATPPLPDTPTKSAANLIMIAFAVCSIGERIDREIGALSARRSSLELLVLHGATLALLEAVARSAYQHLADTAGRHGLFAGLRLEPGCQQLPLEWQTDLFNRVAADRIGVTLSESLVMTPARSLSFVVPITTTRPTLSGENKCLACARENCLQRTPVIERKLTGNG
ncbi:MAG: hypothetical protein IH612_12135 [Desulfofustis sp.]|nr:hypothetical protein [Desulfofustis sp.]